MMARLAEWRDDVSGTITTAGSSTAYTVASNQGFDTLADLNGAMIAFVPHATNGAIVTLNVDGLGAKPLRFGPGLELQSGVLIQGTPYAVSYNNADGAFYLQGRFANPYGIPLGGMMPYIGASAPNSAFVIPIGQTVNRTTYATLFSLVGTTFGTGDGSTTFGIPDLRGRTVFQPDSGGSGRITVAGGNFDGTVLGGTGGAQNNTIGAANVPQLSFSGTLATIDVGNVLKQVGGPQQVSSGSGITVNQQDASANYTPAGTVNTGSANTPITNLPPAIVLPYILRII
jgi:microcystin-dependent protein